MSNIYYTPQRMVTGHTTRFMRRAADSSGVAAPAPLDLHAWFNPQLLSTGERETVYAQFAAGVVWSAVSATFTLWAAGAPTTGYNGIAALAAADPSNRLYTTSVTIDLTLDAEYALAGGNYYGEFLVTTSTGQIVAARGKVTIVTRGANLPPGEYETGGGLA